MKQLTSALLVMALIATGNACFGQDLSKRMAEALRNDDTAGLAALIDEKNINECHGELALLAEAIHGRSPKCFEWLLEKGADVNKACGDTKSPVFVVAKHGKLDQLKKLVAKGAKLDGIYRERTLIAYAREHGNNEVVAYLEELRYATK